MRPKSGKPRAARHDYGRGNRNRAVGHQSAARRRARRLHRRRRHESALRDASLRRRVRYASARRRARFCSPMFRDAPRRMELDLIVPIVVENEFLPLDDARELFESIGCRLALPPRRIVERTADKLVFASSCARSACRDPRRRAYSPNDRGRALSGLPEAAARFGFGRHVAR